MIERPPFTSTRLQEERDKDDFRIIPIRLNATELKNLDYAKKFLEQTKDGTTIKLLMELGLNVIQRQETGLVIGAIFKNRRNNKRNGIIDFE